MPPCWPTLRSTSQTRLAKLQSRLSHKCDLERPIDNSNVPTPLPPFDFDLLRTFVAIADNASFTRAAERIGRTQSTVSLQIKKLEEGLGRRLLERDGRELQLTPDGEILLNFARRMLHLADEARSRILEPEIDGIVRLGTPEDFGTVYLPDVLARFARTHPRVALEVNCNFSAHLLEGFSKGEYDLVLVKREPQGPSGGIAVWRDVVVWVTGPRLVLSAGQPVPLVLAPTPDIYRKRALAALEAANYPWRIAYTSASMEGLQAAVRAGLGITVMSKEMIPQGLSQAGEELDLPRLPDAEIALYRAPGGISRAAELLADHIVHSLEAGAASSRASRSMD
jgi:DNA-binding transcriptional LysR family regulator